MTTLPLKPEYGNWRVMGPAVVSHAQGRIRRLVPCECKVHGTKRNIFDYELRNGTAYRCMMCVRKRCSPRVMPTRRID